MNDAQIEQMAKAAFEFDWPKDKWERLGPGYHQDRYKGMIRAALTAAPVSAAEREQAPNVLATPEKPFQKGPKFSKKMRTSALRSRKMVSSCFAPTVGFSS